MTHDRSIVYTTHRVCTTKSIKLNQPLNKSQFYSVTQIVECFPCDKQHSPAAKHADFPLILIFSWNSNFFADYCCMTSLKRYQIVCGVVTLEEFEKFNFFKMAAVIFEKLLKPF